MIISIFTPTHNPEHLARCWSSVCNQRIPNGVSVEWVVVPNNGVTLNPNEMDGVRIIPAPDGLKGVGALKRFAVSRCSGDVFVELDHDDELLPGAIEEIAALAINKPDAFIYSATIELDFAGNDRLFGKQYGWEYAEFEGRKYNLQFKPTARSLAEIFFAPNHVRCWTREAYAKSGGHNPNLTICDDQELIIKTYLAGTKFIEAKRPLYRQHLQKKSTQFELNGDIQKEQARIRNQYLQSLVEEQCRREGLLMLDLGGAHSSPKGYIPVDKVKVDGGIQWDISKDLLSFTSLDSIGCIRAHDFLEHIPIGRVVPLMNDIHRVLTPGGFLLSQTPSTDGRGAFQDPTHCSFWNQNSFWYYTRSQQAKYVPEIQCRFQAVQLRTTFPSDWHKEHGISYVIAHLCALKGQRQPGLKEI